MQSLLKQVDLQTSSNVCIECHYIQLKHSLWKVFIELCTSVLIQEYGTNFSAVVDIAATCCVSFMSHSWSLCVARCIFILTALFSWSSLLQHLLCVVHTKIWNYNHMLQRWTALHANLQNLAWCIKLLLLGFYHTH